MCRATFNKFFIYRKAMAFSQSRQWPRSLYYPAMFISPVSAFIYVHQDNNTLVNCLLTLGGTAAQRSVVCRESWHEMWINACLLLCYAFPVVEENSNTECDHHQSFFPGVPTITRITLSVTSTLLLSILQCIHGDNLQGKFTNVWIRHECSWLIMAAILLRCHIDNMYE